MKQFNIYFPLHRDGLGAYLLDISGRLSNENTPTSDLWSGTLDEAWRLIEARGWIAEPLPIE